MSSFSKTYYRTGWVRDLEFILWNTLQNGPKEFGYMRANDEECKKLMALAKVCGGWIFYHSDEHEKFIEADRWK